MNLSLNEDTKTLDFIEGGVEIFQISIEEAGRRGVPFSRDVHDYGTIILDDVSKLVAREETVPEGTKYVISLNGVDLAEFTVGSTP
jgi:hypothetical protein